MEECRANLSSDALVSLKFCLQDPRGLAEALQLEACGTMVQILSDPSQNPEILMEALHNLASLTNPPPGKEEAIEQGAVKPCVLLLRHSEWLVQAAAVKALASLVIHVKGKKQAFDLNVVDSLVDLIYHNEPTVVIVAVRALGSVAEFKKEVKSTPQDGVYRAIFDVALPQLNTLAQNEDRSLAKAARDTSELIKWRP
eukprot:CAMPEP_0184326632 /NCGR_PEP_ID=MMETSP1049-20130417/142664_1 /TAXON_ID=77928 /ORGANISM="Proteomonas sulcata, Strain CCMP704" /LENGTH=197 /DNA_ID=CAMNT_0026648835 /DNA_START=392 /DNA_END=985 /DNA_ORIENTATION=-